MISKNQNVISLPLLFIRGICYFLFWKTRFLLKKLLEGNNYPETQIKLGNISFKMFLNMKDKGLSYQLYLSKIREYPNAIYFIDFISKHLSRISAIIDIGSNIGYYPLFENAILKKYGETRIPIYAIEPVKLTFDLLKRNVSYNKASNIKCSNIAIGSDAKKILMAVPKSANLSHVKESIKAIPSASKYKEQYIDMYPLKAFFSKKQIDYERILFRWDIEGYEYQLLKENKDFFKKIKNAYIIMEFHPFLLKRKQNFEFINMLKETGFKLNFVVTCYPHYFLILPKTIRRIMNKVWKLEKRNDPIGLISRIKSLDDLSREIRYKNSPLFNHSHAHLYLSKE